MFIDARIEQAESRPSLASVARPVPVQRRGLDFGARVLQVSAAEPRYSSAMSDSNPLLETEGLPRFSAITPAHVEPAVDALLADYRARIDALLASDGAARFLRGRARRRGARRSAEPRVGAGVASARRQGFRSVARSVCGCAGKDRRACERARAESRALCRIPRRRRGRRFRCAAARGAHARRA